MYLSLREVGMDTTAAIESMQQIVQYSDTLEGVVDPEDCSCEERALLAMSAQSIRTGAAMALIILEGIKKRGDKA